MIRAAALRSGRYGAILLALAVAVAMASCDRWTGPVKVTYSEHPDCDGVRNDRLERRHVTVALGAARVSPYAEVAETSEQKRIGLMCRASVTSGTGMLFPYDYDQTGAFWMFNTYVPLDLLYADRSGRVVHVATLSPCPRVEGEDDSAWSSRCRVAAAEQAPQEPYRLVLELPAGWLATQGIRPDELPGSGSVTVGE